MNIFVTVGSQMSFDRLITCVDSWAKNNHHQIFAQIGATTYKPKNIAHTATIDPSIFIQRIQWADVVIAHAGMGSILSCLQYETPIVVMPRRGSLRETRNDHQVATAERFGEQKKISTAMNEDALTSLLDDLSELSLPSAISAHASDQLISSLRKFIALP